jgi:hypothetical protein
MSKPSKLQLQQAVEVAERLRDLDQDADHLGRTLLYLQQRNAVLERVLDAAKHYLQSGQEQHNHTRLVQAVEAARRQAREESDSLDPDSAFGLE